MPASNWRSLAGVSSKGSSNVSSTPLFALASHAGDLARIEAALKESVHTPDPYLNDIASHLIVAGGKRLQPILTVVAAQVAGLAVVAVTGRPAGCPSG